MDVEELVIGGLTVRIDRLICVGFETCVEVPELFVIDPEGIATFAPTARSVPRDDVIRACESCPVDALQVLDASGRTLVPEGRG